MLLELGNGLALLLRRSGGRRISVSAKVSRHEPSLDLARGGLGELVGDEDARGDLGGGEVEGGIRIQENGTKTFSLEVRAEKGKR